MTERVGTEEALAGTERPQRSRGDRRERGERGERNERRAENDAPATDAMRADPSPAQEADAGAMPGEMPRAEGSEERRPRSRDRYGRDRRERAPRDNAEVRQDAPADADLQPAPQQATLAAMEAAPPSLELPATPAPARPIEVPAPATTADAGRVMPKVTAFELPLADLAQIAEGSGLHWVNSDAERVAQVQATIAAEPRPVHVPRERAPVVELDEGPLILVETRRDLSQVKLPFEGSAAPASGDALRN